MQIKQNSLEREKPSLLLIGSGPVIFSFIERFRREWSLTVVVKESAPDGGLPEAAKVVRGNATDSLVLRQAGAENARAVLAATDSDEVNLEVCRLCGHLFQTEKRLALVRSVQNLSAFEKEGIETIDTGSSIALAAETRLRKGSRAAFGVGLGKGEVYEVTVSPGSTAIGKTPRHLNPQSWLIAAIYREKELIVPHGDTVILEGDSILLVGQPEILPGIANYFRAGTSEFPLQYGARVVGICPDGEDPQVEDEVRYLAEVSEATSYSVLRKARTNTTAIQDLSEPVIETAPGDFQPRQLSRTLDRLDSGCTVMRAPSHHWYHRLGVGDSHFFRFVECHTEPIFVSRGTYPYKRIALGVQPGEPARFAAEMAVDLARGMGAELTAIIAVPPSLVTGEGYREELEQALAEVVRLGEVYGLEVKTLTLDGNPVLTLEEQSRVFDLLVLAHRVGKRATVFNPDVSRHLILRSHCSVLCLPHR